MSIKHINPTLEDVFAITSRQYNFQPTSRPTVKNYVQWYNARIQRTQDVMSKQKEIRGKQIKDENLSMKVLYENGYKLDPSKDMMVRNG